VPRTAPLGLGCGDGLSVEVAGEEPRKNSKGEDEEHV
jgi:hypothetical protein